MNKTRAWKVFLVIQARGAGSGAQNVKKKTKHVAERTRQYRNFATQIAWHIVDDKTYVDTFQLGHYPVQFDAQILFLIIRNGEI